MDCSNYDMCVGCLQKGVMPEKHGTCTGEAWHFYRET